ncbi:MAG TPA: response regulator transcription factor [Gaiellaceae bacterium]|nr:response regulator transcription factor [Gaiellaceae bacterium]
MAKHRVRLVVADDHALVRIGIRHSLEADGGFEIVAEAGSVGEVLPAVGRSSPDAVLLDLDMPGLRGFTILDRLGKANGNVRVVVLADEADPDVVSAAFRHGAVGYLLKSLQGRDLGGAIRQALDGTAFHAHGLPEINDESVLLDAGLSPREADVLRCVARGLKNKDIARELWISVPTVKFHLTNAYRTLGIANRTEAVRWVLEHGIRTENRADVV